MSIDDAELEALLQAELDELSSGSDAGSDDGAYHSDDDDDERNAVDEAFDELASPDRRLPTATDWSALMAATTSGSLLDRFEDELGELAAISSIAAPTCSGGESAALLAAGGAAVPATAPALGPGVGTRPGPGRPPPPTAVAVAVGEGAQPVSMRWCNDATWLAVVGLSATRDIEALATSSRWCHAQFQDTGLVARTRRDARARAAHEALVVVRAQRQRDTARASEEIARAAEARRAEIERSASAAQSEIDCARAAREAQRRERDAARAAAEAERAREEEAQRLRLEADRVRRAVALRDVKVAALSRRSATRRAVASVVRVQRASRARAATHVLAALSLQRCARRRRERRAELARVQRAAAAATRLQASGRGRAARRTAQLRRDASGALRSCVRAWLARRRVEALRVAAAALAALSEAERARAAKEGLAAAVVQSAARGASARRRVEALRVARVAAVRAAAERCAANAREALAHAAAAAAAADAAATVALAAAASAVATRLVAATDGAVAVASEAAAAAARAAVEVEAAAAKAEAKAEAAISSAVAAAHAAAEVAAKLARHAFVAVARASVAVSTSLLAAGEEESTSQSSSSSSSSSTPHAKVMRLVDDSTSPSSPVALSLSLEDKRAVVPAPAASSSSVSPRNFSSEEGSTSSPLSVEDEMAPTRVPMQGGAARALMQRRGSKKQAPLPQLHRSHRQHLDPDAMAKIARDAAMAALRAYAMPQQGFSTTEERSISSSSEGTDDGECSDSDSEDAGAEMDDEAFFTEKKPGPPSALTVLLNRAATQLQRIARGRKVRKMLRGVRYDDGDNFDYEADLDLADFDDLLDGFGGLDLLDGEATPPKKSVPEPKPKQQASSSAEAAASGNNGWAWTTPAKAPNAGPSGDSPVPLYVGPRVPKNHRPSSSSTNASTISLDSESSRSSLGSNAAGSLILSTRGLRGRAASSPQAQAKPSPAERMALQKEWGFADAKTMELLLKRRRRMLGPAPDPRELARQRRMAPLRSQRRQQQQQAPKGRRAPPQRSSAAEPGAADSGAAAVKSKSKLRKKKRRKGKAKGRR